MAGVDDTVEKLFKDCPILLNKDFQKKYPAILEVVAFINEVARSTIRMRGKYEFFERFGIKDIGGYVRLIQQGDPKAIASYKSLRATLCL